MESPLIASLRRAVAAAPEDATLRMHLAEQLDAAGDQDAAVECAAAVLQRDPTHAAALALIARAANRGSDAPAEPDEPDEPDEPGDDQPASPRFDWHAAEQQVTDIAGPAFVTASDATESAPDGSSGFDVETSTITLDDVGGLDAVKERLQAAFLMPLRNPELRRLYAKSLRGGLLLYGPPGCGKTFLAKAVAGELGAKFLSVGITDVLDPYLGSSERNLHELFAVARREAPCVVFLDEADALAQRRTQVRSGPMRAVVNQLLVELDGVDGVNDGVFVLAASNQPWDVDPAMRRPGRLDRTLLVLPPDPPAREAIFRYHLRDRPIEGVDVRELAQRSDGLSGADIAYACEVASERALVDGVRSGQPRLISMTDLRQALGQTPSSLGPWLETARNVVLYADQDGTYADLRAYLKRAKRL